MLHVEIPSTKARQNHIDRPSSYRPSYSVTQGIRTGKSRRCPYASATRRPSSTYSTPLRQRHRCAHTLYRLVHSWPWLFPFWLNRPDFVLPRGVADFAPFIDRV